MQDLDDRVSAVEEQLRVEQDDGDAGFVGDAAGRFEELTTSKFESSEVFAIDVGNRPHQLAADLGAEQPGLPNAGRAQDLADLDAARRTKKHRFAASQGDRFGGGEATQSCVLAERGDVLIAWKFGVRHEIPSVSFMMLSYVSAPCSVDRSSRISLMTLIDSSLSQ